MTQRDTLGVPPAVVEDFAATVSRLFGSPPMTARVMALLALTDRSPVTTEELRDHLGASAGSISETTRELVEAGAIEKVKVPGDLRRHRFQVLDDPWRFSNEHLLTLVTAMKALAERSLESLGERESPPEYLLEMADYYGYLESELPALFARYERRRRRRRKNASAVS